jgi:hypothetical protein
MGRRDQPLSRRNLAKIGRRVAAVSRIKEAVKHLSLQEQLSSAGWCADKLTVLKV